MEFLRFRLIDGQNLSISNDSKKACLIAGGFWGSLILMMVIWLGTAFAGKIPEETHRKLKNVSIPFIMNQGQMDRQVRFYAKTFSGTVYVTDQGKMVYQLPTSKDQKNQGWVLTEEALDCLPKKEIKGEKESETQVSFFIGNNHTKWKSGLSTYETVDLGEIYKGIKLKLRAYGGSVEKLYYVSPGKEPKEIRIKVNGADSLKVNDKGELEVQTGNGPVIFSRPKAFQQKGNKQKNVDVAYLVEGDRYGFKVGKYDITRELVIDPLIQSTYLGGSQDEKANSIVISGEYVYVAGKTLSTNFPGTTGGAQPAYGGGGSDGFVSLLSADLKHLFVSTYLGGNGNDWANSIVVSGGNVYVAGETSSSNFPGTSGGAQPWFWGGDSDAFVALLSYDLKQIIQSTYLGGNGSDSASLIAVSGVNIYVAGYTASTNFPKTAGGAQPGYGGGFDYWNDGDAVVALLSADLKTLIQSTYLGGNDYDSARTMAVSGGNVYVAGQTWSTNFPKTAGGAQPANAGGTPPMISDGFVALLSADLKTLIQSTYLGGTNTVVSVGALDVINSIAVSGGNIYVAGQTDSTNFPGTIGGAQPGFGGHIYAYDGFVSLLSADLKQIIQSTYLGGNDTDGIYSIVVSEGNVYVAGQTSSPNFPKTAGGAQPASGGSQDAFVALLSADLKQIIQSTYLGGNSSDSASSIAVSGGNVYVAGYTYSPNFPKTVGGAQPASGGSNDNFVSWLTADLRAVSPPTTSSAPPWLLLLLGN